MGYDTHLPLTLYNSCDDAVAINSISSSAESFYVSEVPEDSSVSGYDSVLISVHFQPFPNLECNGTLHIFSSSGHLQIGLNGYAISCIELPSGMISFGEVHLGSTARWPLIVRNVSDSAVVIRNLYFLNGENYRIRYNPEDSLIAGQDSLIIPVEFFPTEKDSYSDRLDLETTGGSVFTLLSGRGITSFQTSTDSLAFGNVGAGRVRQALVALYNNSDTVLTVYQVSIHDTSFTIDFTPEDSLISSGDSLEVLVTFHPIQENVWHVDSLRFHGRYEDIALVVSGKSVSTGADKLSVGIPGAFYLEPCYPNPFNTEVTIRYDVPQRSEVKLLMYSVLGRQVATLVEQGMDAGYHRAIWNAGDLPSGIYFVRMEAGNFVQTRKVVLLK